MYASDLQNVYKISNIQNADINIKICAKISVFPTMKIHDRLL